MLVFVQIYGGGIRREREMLANVKRPREARMQKGARDVICKCVLPYEELSVYDLKLNRSHRSPSWVQKEGKKKIKN